MKRLLFFAGLMAFLVWRSRTLDAHDREHGYGAYADVAPITED